MKCLLVSQDRLAKKLVGQREERIDHRSKKTFLDLTMEDTEKYGDYYLALPAFPAFL